MFREGLVKRSKGGARKGGGRTTLLHRAECRKLVEKYGVRGFFAQIVDGAKKDFTVTLDGKVINVPASIRNRLFAGQFLVEQGYGKAPQEIQHTISPSTIREFETALLNIFQNLIPRSCPHCKTLIKLPSALGEAIMKLSEIFERDPAYDIHDDEAGD